MSKLIVCLKTELDNVERRCVTKGKLRSYQLTYRFIPGKHKEAFQLIKTLQADLITKYKLSDITPLIRNRLNALRECCRPRADDIKELRELLDDVLKLTPGVTVIESPDVLLREAVALLEDLMICTDASNQKKITTLVNRSNIYLSTLTSI